MVAKRRSRVRAKRRSRSRETALRYARDVAAVRRDGAAVRRCPGSGSGRVHDVGVLGRVGEARAACRAPRPRRCRPRRTAAPRVRRARAGGRAPRRAPPGRVRCPAPTGETPTTYTSPRPSSAPLSCTLVQWNATISPSRSATSSPAGSNHDSAIRSSRPGSVELALLGVVGEGGGVDREQPVLVLPGHEGAYDDAVGGRAHLVERVGRPPHHPQLAGSGEARAATRARLPPGGCRATTP